MASLDVARGWEYGLIPTRDLGLERRVWINGYGRPGSADYLPCDELPDLSGLPMLLGCTQSRALRTRLQGISIFADAHGHLGNSGSDHWFGLPMVSLRS